jgi:hypothetical protein
MGRPQSTGSGMKQHLEQASFVDVKVTGVEKPYSPWPKNERMKWITPLRTRTTICTTFSENSSAPRSFTEWY